jgi:hypothetical protein
MSRATNWSKVYADRQRGVFCSTDMLDELNKSVKDMTSNDVVLTMFRNTGYFNVYSMKEFLPQIKRWKELKCVLLDANVFERKIGGKTVYGFVVQPENLEDSPLLCPLALCMNFRVSGYTYITTQKSMVELIKRVLSTHE